MQNLWRKFKFFPKNPRFSEFLLQSKIIYTYFKPYRFKFLFLTTIIVFPFLSRRKKYSDFKKLLDSEIEQTSSEFIEEFLKILCKNVLNDDQIKRESVFFFEELTNQITLQTGVSDLLSNTLNDKEFQDQFKLFFHDIYEKINRNEEIKDDLLNLLIRTLRDDEIKFEILDVITYLFKKKEIKECLIDLFDKGMKNSNIQDALNKALKAAFYEILMNKETVIKMRRFWVNLIDKETDENGLLANLIISFRNKLAFNDSKLKPFEENEKKKIREFFF